MVPELSGDASQPTSTSACTSCPLSTYLFIEGPTRSFQHCQLACGCLKACIYLQVTALVEHLLSEENQNKHLRLVILLLVIFTAILLAGTFGLT